LFKIYLVTFLFFTNLYSASIGIIEQGVKDKTEQAYALISRHGKTIIVYHLNFVVKKDDKIKTFRRSRLTIRLNDNTVIKMGKKTTLIIDKYVYDVRSRKKNYAANFRISNGSFQIKTGRIGEISPRNFKIKTKFSTIGLRG